MRLVLSCWAILLGCITLYYGVISQDSLPDHPILQGKNDLFLHAMAFLSLTMPIFVLWPTWRSLIALAFIASAIELVQAFLPSRTPALDDLAASCIGIAAGAMIAALICRYGRLFQRGNQTHASSRLKLSLQSSACDTTACSSAQISGKVFNSGF